MFRSRSSWIVSSLTSFGSTSAKKQGRPAALIQHTWHDERAISLRSRDVGGSALAQLGAPRLRKIVPGMRGPGSVSVGIACILNGATVLRCYGAQRCTGPVRFCTAGPRIQHGLTTGSASVRQAYDSAEQAALSSKYAAETYLPSMAGVLVGGALGNLVGLPAATYVLFGFGALAPIPLMRLAPKLGEVG